MYKVLDTNSPKWNEYIERLPLDKRDIYYLSDYYKLYEKEGFSLGKLFVYKEDDNLALYPFLLSEIKGYELKETYYDIETSYGYGGPVTSSMKESFLQNFEEAFLKFCNENNIAAEFIRFHPLIKNENIFKKNIKVFQNRKTVYIDLSGSVEEIWKNSIDSKNRNMIRKGEKEGLTVEESFNYINFKKIYEETMSKVSADKFYYFDEEYYERMKKSNNYTLLNVIHDKEVIAAGIFMYYGEYFHYHLSGSLKEYLKFAPNNLMLWEAVKLGKKKGMHFFHLGGGIQNSMEDRLFKFKQSFSKNTSDFYIGKRIHNEAVYKYLIEKWEEKNKIKAGRLLQYKEE